MNVLVFGGTGIVGRPIIEKALVDGYNVTLFTRNKSKVDIINSKLNIVEGNVNNVEDVEKAIEGQDVVIQCIGIGGKGDGKKTTIASDANETILKAMKRMGVKRYIAMSVIGAGDSWKSLPWIYRKCILPWFQSWFVPIIEDKNRMESAILKENLDWTIIRGTTVKESLSKGKVKAIIDGKGISYSVVATDLANFIVSQVKDKTFIKQTPVVCN